MFLLLNAVLYQTIWLTCILGGFAGAFIGLVLLGLHLGFSQNRREDLKLILVFLFTGLLVDGTLHCIGFFSFTQSGWPIPFWLAVIWMGLAVTVNHSLSWLKGRFLPALIFGALGGPLAYWAGVRLGAATFLWSLPASLLFLSVIWSILAPLLFLKTGTAAAT